MNEEDEKGLWDARSGLRTSLGLGFEVGANTLLDIFSFIPPAQVAGGTFINYLAQKIRGGEISKGELTAAGLTSLIPGGAQAGALTRAGRLTRSVAKGGLAGGITATSMPIVDEGRLPTASELALGTTAGGLFGGAFDLAPAAFTGRLGKEVSDIKYDSDVFLRQLRGQITGGPRIDHPDIVYRSGKYGFGEGTVGAAKPTDPKDFVSNEQIASWRTVGQKSQPLNYLFGRDAGWRGGRLNLKSWRDHPLKGDKNIAEQFLTAPGKGVVFSTEKNKEFGIMSRIFGITGAEQLLELPEGSQRIIQAHHMTATKAVLRGQEGIVYDSAYYHQLQKIWEDLELTLGNNPKNIQGTIGHVQRDLNSPHSLVHKFLDNEMGRDGSRFWTQEMLDQIVIYDNAGNAIGNKNFELRKEWTIKQAGIFKEAIDLFNLATEQFYLARGVRRGEYLRTLPILDEEIVDAFFNKLPPKGGTGKYNTNVISRIAKEIADEPNVKPTITYGSLKQLLAKLRANRRLKKEFDQMYKFAVNEMNGEEMLIDVLFNGLTPTQALKKWRKNDPQFRQLSIRFNRALEQAKNPKVLQQLKKLDTSLLDTEIRRIDPSDPLDRTLAPEDIQTDIDEG